MLEIVHDLAPGADLFFATAGLSEASFAQNILDLRAAGCDIIMDDIGYFDESPFQDGIVAQAVNAVVADGALYFSAAGNEGNLDRGTAGTWEGDFVNGGAAGVPVNGKAGNIHRFGTVNFDTVTGNQPGNATVLFWSDPLGASTNDYDLYILNNNSSAIISASLTVQDGTQDPFEIVPPGNPGERVVVVRTAGAASRFLHVDTLRGRLLTATAGNVRGHAAAASAIAVAAVDVHTAFPGPFTGGLANPVETFSSDGPRRAFFSANGTPLTPGNFSATGGVLRQKPDMAAGDGVVTTLSPISGLNPFFGTSAATPHAASIAALVKSYNQDLTSAQIRQIMSDSALDNMGPGIDRDSGAGIAMALQAIQAAPIPVPRPRLLVLTNILSGGNGNGVIDLNECNSLDLVLTNKGNALATGVHATLTTSTPGAAVIQKNANYPNIPAGGAATGLTPFQISTSSNFVCGTKVELVLVVKSDQNTRTNTFELDTGAAGVPNRFDSLIPVPIPDADPNGVSSSLFVSGINSSIQDVTVSLFITHPFDIDLVIQLIGPDGTIVNLSQNNGLAGQNYGVNCSPDSSRTTFSDAGTVPISSGAAPFVGTFRPDQPLAVFRGKSGAKANGVWQLHVTDLFALDTGVIQCWSLELSQATCTDGGGRCPGIDTSVGMTDSPFSVILQSNLTYSISVTNNGPDVAKNVGVTQILPASATILSATPSQGSATFSSGLMTASLGSLDLGATATVTVVVRPNVLGSITSTATVSSQEPDFEPANNSVTVTSQVVPPNADLALGLAATPNPVSLGGVLTYTVSVTNNGPVVATNTVVTTVLPANVTFISADVSQGGAVQNGSNIVCNLNNLNPGSIAVINIHVRAIALGAITASSSVSSVVVDPFIGNNSASVGTTVTPSSDLSLTMTGKPVSAVRGSNITYVLTVVNLGPSPALSVNINDPLPSGATYVANTSGPGVVSTFSAGVMNSSISNLAVGTSVSVTNVVGTAGIPTNLLPVTLTNIATVSSSGSDPNTANNSATIATRVDFARATVVAAGASLVSESGVPPNGFVDPGEQVTINLRLQNIGNQDTVNLVATLLATNGVTPLGSQVKTYGVLSPTNGPVSNSFTFTAAGAGSSVTAVLQLQDGANNLGTVQFTFTFPAISTFSNTADIVIPDFGAAAPYPSTINVSGVTGLIGKLTVTMTNVNHTFPDDVDILLVGPAGQTTLLMSHAGDSGVLTGVALTFDDAAAFMLPPSGQISAGTYRPSAYGSVSFPTPSPGNPPPQPYTTNLTTFNGTNANGIWSLYVADSFPGDQGFIAGGWSLTIATGTPVNQGGDVAITGSAVPNPVLAGNNLTYTFNITNNGPNTSSSVAFTNQLPAGVKLVSAVSTQGSVATNSSGLITCQLGSLGLGTNVVITIIATPTIPGLLTNIATATAAEGDLNQADNTATVVSTVNAPVADMALTFSSAPNPAVVGAGLVYTINVTNNGPGTAFGVVVTNPLNGITFNSGFASPPLAVPFVTNGAVVCNLGDLAAGSAVTLTLNLTPPTITTVTNVATVLTVSSDPVSSNNSVSVPIQVANPAPNIAIAGTRLTDGFLPPNGTVDPGEIVTLSLVLTNSGTADTVNLTATLLATNGVSPVSGAQNYGALIHGGAVKSNNFTFSATGPNGAVIAAVFKLQDGSTNLGNLVLNLNLPATNTFTSGTTITIPESGAATPYPSIINISGVTGLVSKVTVTLSNFTHAFPDDVDILLVGPGGQRTILMSDTGGAHAVTNVTLTLDDASGIQLPDSGALTNGTYRPTDYEPGDLFPPSAPSGPYVASLGVFSGANPNGNWALYVFDDTPGDGGNISGGWSLNITTINPVNSAADLSITAGQPAGILYSGAGFDYTVGVTNKGPANASGVSVVYTPPAGFNFITSSLGSFNIGAGSVTLNVGGLAAGAVTNFSVTVSSSVVGSYYNTFAVSANEVDLDPPDNSFQILTTIQPVSAIQLGGAIYTNGTFQLTLTGQPGLSYVIQASTNLTGWIPVVTNVATGGSFIYIDTNASSFPNKYYRGVIAP
jgi:uncharacterized repeat protein (TIGR01451 family)